MRSLREISLEIKNNWIVINNLAARKAVEDMSQIEDVSKPYGTDPSGYGVIGSFLTHASGWKGEVAKRIKEELRAMCSKSGGKS